MQSLIPLSIGLGTVQLHPCAGGLVGYKRWHDATATSRTRARAAGELLADQLPTQAPARVSQLLTEAEFHKLADVPPEVEWFANLSNPQTWRAYEHATRDFMGFTGIKRPDEYRTVTRAHIIAWRDDLYRPGFGGSTIRHRLSSLAALLGYLCEKNSLTHNPVKGVQRPKTESGEGKTPELGDRQ